ncbi:MAG: phosphoadenylyl-sulfate reductase [Hyphomicrobiaceae bacterium]|nr:MAG: phosphoadenylyl-sulfate reductase [Hyphomicrobiaceae bacterium]
MQLRTVPDAGGDTAAKVAERLAGLARLADRVAEIRRLIRGTITFSTSLGLEDQAILHAIAEAGSDIDMFMLDTGRLFPETLEALQRSEQRYGVRIRVLAPAADELEQLVARDGAFGFRLSLENRKACCEVRKVRPLKRALKGAAGWITGLRRGQSSGRAQVPFAAWDGEHGLIKLNPIADWSAEQLDAYIAANDIPVNALHARGFPSIGCQPCTRAIRPGEDIRAGRWWWESEDGKECGLHAAARTRAEATA